MHKLCYRTERDTPSSGWTASHRKTFELAAIDLVQDRGQSREGAEESESMRRSPVTQQSTDTNSSSPLSLSVFFALSDTSAAHLCSEQCLAATPFPLLKIGGGHWMYMV